MLSEVDLAADPKQVGAAAEDALRLIDEYRRPERRVHRRGIAYDGPVFAIWGDHDRLVPLAHADGVLMALPQARVDVWRGMGHHPIRERFEDLIATIERAAYAAERRTMRRLPAYAA